LIASYSPQSHGKIIFSYLLVSILKVSFKKPSSCSLACISVPECHFYTHIGRNAQAKCVIRIVATPVL